MDGMLSKIGEYFFDDEDFKRRQHKERTAVMARAYYHDYDLSVPDDLSSTASATTTSNSHLTGTRRQFSTASTDYDDDYEEDDYEEEPSRVIPGTVCADLSFVSVSERSVISESGTEVGETTSSSSSQYSEQTPTSSKKPRQKHRVGGTHIRLPLYKNRLLGALNARPNDSDSVTTDDSLAARSRSPSQSRRRRLHLRLKPTGVRQAQDKKKARQSNYEARDDTTSDDNKTPGRRKQHVHEIMDEISSTSSSKSAEIDKKDMRELTDTSQHAEAEMTPKQSKTSLPKIHLIQTTQSDVISIATDGKDFVAVLSLQEDEEGGDSSSIAKPSGSQQDMTARIHSWVSKHSRETENSNEEKIELTMMTTSTLTRRSSQETSGGSNENDDAMQVAGDDESLKNDSSPKTEMEPSTDTSGSCDPTLANDAEKETTHTQTKRAKNGFKSMLKGIKLKLPKKLLVKTTGVEAAEPSVEVVPADSTVVEDASQPKHSDVEPTSAATIEDVEDDVPPPSQVSSTRRDRSGPQDADEHDDTVDVDRPQPSSQSVSSLADGRLKAAKQLKEDIPLKKPASSLLKGKSGKQMPVRFSGSVVSKRSKQNKIQAKRLIQDPFLYHLQVVPSIDSNFISPDNAGMEISFSQDSSVSHDEDDQSNNNADDTPLSQDDNQKEEDRQQEPLEPRTEFTSSTPEINGEPTITTSGAKKKRFFTSKMLNIKKKGKAKSAYYASGGTPATSTGAPKEVTKTFSLFQDGTRIDIISADESASHRQLSKQISGNSSGKGSSNSSGKQPTVTEQHQVRMGSVDKSHLAERLESAGPSINTSRDRVTSKQKWDFQKPIHIAGNASSSKDAFSKARKHATIHDHTGGTPKHGETNPHIDMLTGKFRPTQFFDSCNPRPTGGVVKNGDRPIKPKADPEFSFPLCVHPQASMESQSYYSCDVSSTGPKQKKSLASHTSTQRSSKTARWDEVKMVPVHDSDQGEDHVEVHVINPPVMNKRKGALGKLRGILKRNHHKGNNVVITAGDVAGSHDKQMNIKDHNPGNLLQKESGSSAEARSYAGSKKNQTQLQRVLSERRKEKEMINNDDASDSISESELRTLSYSTTDAVDLADVSIRNQRVLDTLNSIHAFRTKKNKYRKREKNQSVWINHLVDNCAEGVMDPIIDEIEDVACGRLQ